MKTLQAFICGAVSLVITSCSDVPKALPDAIGKPYELLVIAPQKVWKSEVSDTVKAIFGEEVEMLNIPEPLYNVSSVTPEQMTTILDRHRNILFLTVNAQKYPKTKLTAQFDDQAAEQTRINIGSPSIDSLTDFIWANRDLILKAYDKSERDRFMSKALKHKNVKLSKMVEDKFGFHIDIPSTYTLRDEQENFMWISYELPLASLGFIIYTFDKKDQVELNFLNSRNEAVQKVPGPSEGSYMSTDTTFMPTLKNVKINGAQWAEMRGFWNVKGDFMGGPFANFTTTDPITGKMVGIDCYVMSPSPKYGMRNYIRQLEALVLTVKFEQQ